MVQSHGPHSPTGGMGRAVLPVLEGSIFSLLSVLLSVSAESWLTGLPSTMDSMDSVRFSGAFCQLLSDLF